jgi:hypothetical protein
VDGRSQVDRLEGQIREIIQSLLAYPSSPHVRELRAKATTYGRVISGWALYPPTPAQFDAMSEVVDDLKRKVADAGPPKASARPARDARPRPASTAPRELAVTAPPPPPSRGDSLPPTARGDSPRFAAPPPLSEFDAFEAALRESEDESSTTGVRARNRKGAGPDAQARRGTTMPPPSRKRPATDTKATPIPALLNTSTRRSR